MIIKPDGVYIKFNIPINADGFENDSGVQIRDEVKLELSNEILFYCAKKLHDKAIRAKLVNDSLEGLE